LNASSVGGYVDAGLSVLVANTYLNSSYALALYGHRKKDTGGMCATLDELRYVFVTKTDKPASTYPPTEDAFKQHVLLP
jgi:hypothetical protein